MNQGLRMAARDGIEPPTPAFSGLLTDQAKRFGINTSSWLTDTYFKSVLGSFGMVWDVFASSMFPYCSRASFPAPAGPTRLRGAHEGRHLRQGQHQRPELRVAAGRTAGIH